MEQNILSLQKRGGSNSDFARVLHPIEHYHLTDEQIDDKCLQSITVLKEKNTRTAITNSQKGYLDRDIPIQSYDRLVAGFLKRG
ncbi:MAG: hypothetical protein ABW148_15465 [Sedimenticola sp.]